MFLEGKSSYNPFLSEEENASKGVAIVGGQVGRFSIMPETSGFPIPLEGYRQVTSLLSICEIIRPGSTEEGLK